MSKRKKCKKSHPISHWSKHGSNILPSFFYTLMLDSQRTLTPKFSQSETWSIDSFNANDDKATRVVRKFISSAIYVEKPITEMPPARKTSPYFLNSNSDSDFIYRPSTSVPDVSRPIIIKRCSCNSNPESCPCHSLEENLNTEYGETRRIQGNMLESPRTNSSSDMQSQVTVKSRKTDFPRLGSEMRLSLTSLATDRTGDIDPVEKDRIIKCWMKKKNDEKRRREMEELKMREAKETARQVVIERERENFRKWLADKKHEEEKRKQLKEKEEEEEKLREAEKEKRQVENELCFHMWLRRKKRTDLEKKIKDKLALLQVYEEKQRRIEENAMAFDDWLENSRNKQKPIPFNQGLKSLCSSTSVTYINPVPWTPNIEVAQKPASQ